EANLPPFKLPDEANFSGLKSSSVGGEAPNFSGLAIQDALGQEFVQLHSERDLMINAEQHKVVNVGGDHHVNVANVHMTTVGGLPTGSGGGGGGNGGNGAGNITYKTPFNWYQGDQDNPSVAIMPGKNLQLIYGEQTVAVTGLASPWSFGCYTQVVINPLAWTGLIPIPWFPYQLLSGFLAGQAYFTIGSYTTATYGMAWNMSRGPEVNVTGQPSALTQVLANLFAVVSTAGILVAGALDPESKAGVVGNLSLLGASGG